MKAEISDEDREKTRDILCKPMCRFWGMDRSLCAGGECCRAAETICPEYKAGCQALADAKAAEREKWWKAGQESMREQVRGNDAWLEDKLSRLTGPRYDAKFDELLPIEPLPTPEQGEKP